MKRLTNDNPQDNVSSALNLFYVKDGWTWVRGGGPGPDYADISLNDYVRMIAMDHGLEIAKSSNEDEISCEMADLLFDGASTVEGIVATLYAAGWAFAELRDRLKRYEDLEAQDRSNDPLTLEELQEMAWSQSPVWCSDTDGLHAGLMCIRDDWCAPGRTPHIWLLDEEGNSGVYSVKTLLKAGAVFYCRKPEDVTI